MNVKYFYEFRGLDEVLNRVEILTNAAVSPVSITPDEAPFILDYPEQKKLTTIQGSGASIRIKSQSVFQFTDLHTDDMQGCMVKFYRAGNLYWSGWLDSELYCETLSDYPPYPVEFSAADFNVMERIKFRNEDNSAYADIATLLTQLKRCFDKLGLPFGRLYIGCSTIANGVSLSSSETILHKLYVQSSNFYDEDNEPMTCREVIESILQPFGLMMVQRGANVYIYDYNTVKASTAMKCYNFSSLSYIGDTAVNFNSGEVLQRGTASTEGGYGFEEMINNAKITSSLYAENPIYDKPVNIDSMSESISIAGDSAYKFELFGKDKNIEGLYSASKFAIYTNNDSNGTLIGAVLPYTATGTTSFYRIDAKKYVAGTEKRYYINVKMSVYVNMRDNPFDTENDADYSQPPYKGAKTLEMDCNLYTVDENGSLIRSFTNSDVFNQPRWVDYIDKDARLVLYFCNQEVGEIPLMINRWAINSNVLSYNEMRGGRWPLSRIPDKDLNIGVNVPLPTDGSVYGYLIFEITNASILGSIKSGDYGSTAAPVKNILINDISISVMDADGNKVPTDDYEFRSYVNKKVAADYEEVKLKVISANTDQLPIGKANIYRREDNAYKLQISFTRAGQTDILERLLMCTIHSNYTAKNEKFAVDINMADNPIMSYIGYSPVLSDKYLVIGCSLDFHNAKTTINAVSFSADAARLSDIPYD
ncbi:MAG: hypothetical protein LBR26_09465 [Prevotella sp.]|jgi:hypothetical protein|nr:hypothetical protein [Prevotella sp.]